MHCFHRKIMRTSVKFLLAIAACCSIAVIYKTLKLSSPQDKLHQESVGLGLKNETKKKIILGWTTFFREPMSTGHLWACPELNCEILSDRRLLDSSSALIFHVGDLNWKDLPPRRRQNQYYVFLSHETPLYTQHVNVDGGGSGFFNLSLTYRRDSDLYFPYSAFRKREKVLQIDDVYLDSLIKNRTKIVAWMASNCNSYGKRELYVAELQKHINVDVYGTCGRLKCSKSEKCEEMLRQNYKFYLAFENSNCMDYVTEKFIVRANQEIVPIVMWKKNYIGYAPNMSYISIEDFATPKDLANYLNYLDKNPNEYKKYLLWRAEYETGACKNGQYCGFCKLCQMIQAPQIEQKITKSMGNWWFNSSSCDNSLIPKLLSLK